ncbi:MAG TPA: VCBS repeat-containing protein [Pyrinomonadaceae bacterium]|nr:VCBS repeat-containing protein [Pyrinomonadaceae bacterium]
MKKIIKTAKLLTVASFIFLLNAVSANLAFAQCGNYFKTTYRKVIPDYLIYSPEDWTGDGKADFWRTVANTSNSTQNILVYPNNGNGDFDWNNPIVMSTPIPADSSFGFVLIDFNQDGKKDFYIYSQSIGLTIYLNNSNSSFTALTNNPFADESNQNYAPPIGFIDVNSDGILDLIRNSSVANQSAKLNYRLGNANGTFGARVEILSSSVSSRIIRDFNGDGKQDIAINVVGNLSVLFNNGNGTFTSGPEDTNYRGGLSGSADFDADGKSDLIVRYYESIINPQSSPRHLWIYKSLGDGTFAKTEIPAFQANSSQSNITSIQIADFNGDNAQDIIEIAESFYSVYLNNGSGGFSRTDYKRFLGDASEMEFINFNNDNKIDIYFKTVSQQTFRNFLSEPFVVIKTNQCNSVGETKRANFDNDLLSDLMQWKSSTGSWSSINGKLLGGSDAPKRFNWGASGDIPAPGDYDGDGYTDYAVFRPTSGDWYINRSSDSGFVGLHFGSNGDIAVPNDYDGDGKTDIAVYRPTSGDWYIFNSGTQQFSAIHFGASGDKPVAQDYDGDGKTDVAVFRPSSGDWYYLKSSDQSFVGIRWGISTDVPIPADYDADGKSDITVFRNGDWYILRSSNNSFNYLRWGTAGDIPFGFYQNGESALPLVYRPSTFVWYSFFEQGSGRMFGSNQETPIYFGLPNN